MNSNTCHLNPRTTIRLAVLAALGLFGSHAAYALTADDVVCTGCVNRADLANNVVDSAKIANGAVTEAKLAADVMATINALSAKVASLETTTLRLRRQVAVLRTANTALQTKVTAQQNLLAYFNLTETADPSTGDAYPTVQISGANLQIVNGLGSTGTKNGTGNLIVGYNSQGVGPLRCSDGEYLDEPTCTANGGSWSSQHRSGSHNIVAGDRSSYSASGGLVAGFGNTINRNYASVSGGTFNNASGSYSSVSGGHQNTASGDRSSVSGGWGNGASGQLSSVSGGATNTATGSYSSISGGYINNASGDRSSVSGGANRSASGNLNWSAGGLFQTQ